MPLIHVGFLCQMHFLTFCYYHKYRILCCRKVAEFPVFPFFFLERRIPRKRSRFIALCKFPWPGKTFMSFLLFFFTYFVFWVGVPNLLNCRAPVLRPYRTSRSVRSRAAAVVCALHRAGLNSWLVCAVQLLLYKYVLRTAPGLSFALVFRPPPPLLSPPPLLRFAVCRSSKWLWCCRVRNLLLHESHERISRTECP